MINITSLLAACLMIMPLGDGDKDDKKQSNDDVRDSYYKYEREEVSYYRDRVEFTLPAVPVEEVEPEEIPDPRRLSGRFNSAQRLVVEADPRLGEFVEKHKKINEKIKEINGFKVQIYAGRGTAGRSDASGAHTKFISNYPDEDAKTKFEHPLYRVHVGNFMRREEAELFCREVRTLFPRALVISAKVKIPKYKSNEKEENRWDRN